jgi:hypothetical protein
MGRVRTDAAVMRWWMEKVKIWEDHRSEQPLRSLSRSHGSLLDKSLPARYEPPTESPPIMIEVPPARIPEEPGAVIPHAGICEGGVGQPASLP